MNLIRAVGIGHATATSVAVSENVPADVDSKRETGSKHRLSCIPCTVRVADRLAVNLCPGRDSNPHDLAITNT